jgi:hypothetical protein
MTAEGTTARRLHHRVPGMAAQAMSDSVKAVAAYSEECRCP